MIKIGYTKNGKDIFVESVDSLHVANTRVTEIKKELEDTQIAEFYLEQKIIFLWGLCFLLLLEMKIYYFL